MTSATPNQHCRLGLIGPTREQLLGLGSQMLEIRAGGQRCLHDASMHIACGPQTGCTKDVRLSVDEN
jgi:hypothetical protein